MPARKIAGLKPTENRAEQRIKINIPSDLDTYENSKYMPYLSKSTLSFETLTSNRAN